MSAITVQPNTVITSNTNLVDPRVNTGGSASTRWRDGSDSSFATVYASYNSAVSGSAFQDEMHASLDGVSLPYGSTVSDITVNFRAKTAAETPTPPLRVYASIQNSSGTDVAILTTG